MRVAHIAYQYGMNNTGGAAIASTRLHQALLAHGVESHYICVHAREAGENVHEMPHGWKRKVFLSLTKTLRCIWKFAPYRKSICLNLIPMFGLEKLLNKVKPDIVHIHWLNADVASFEQLKHLPYKCVFNLHDLFIINAIAPYPFSDTRFITGFNRQNSGFLEQFLFARKRKMIERLNASFIGPSEWVCNQCRQSIIGRGRISDAIPNCVDMSFIEQRAMNDAIQGSKFVIIFGSYGGRHNHTKGFSDLVICLEKLPPTIKAQCELRIFGEQAQSCFIGGIATNFLGHIDDKSIMIKELRKAHVFAFPSIAETQGMVKVEAMLCGVPVIAFDRTACAEGIEQGVSGWIANDGDHNEFAVGILRYFELWRAGKWDKVREMVRRHAYRTFNPNRIVEKVIDAYNDKINSN